MATPEGQGQRAGRHPEPAREAEPHLSTGKDLEEASRFAYAALCGMSLAWLFPEPEQSSFRMQFVETLVKWLELPETVLPSMVAFADGLGGEEEATFAEILLKDPVLKNDPLVITQDLLTFSLRNGSYDARARVLVCHVTWLLKIAPEELENLEESLLESLKEKQEEESESAEALRKKRENRKKWKRYLLIGLATVGGGTAIGVTGGLAAPFMAAGAAAIIGTTGAAALGSVAGIAVITSLFGAAGAGLTGYKMKKRVGAIEEFEFLPLSDGKQLHITIAITGWLCSGKYGSFASQAPSLRGRLDLRALFHLQTADPVIPDSMRVDASSPKIDSNLFSGVPVASTAGQLSGWCFYQPVTDDVHRAFPSCSTWQPYVCTG
uniref:Transmembrane and coiled-coil domain-containing protein 4 isoform X3 n=1 Tax=Phascolarctos cinereus TaxID=38626 RepID=A0A6P5J601_PHACI|nr:transmembrane and coiled-coil domain-containing protein 4 isoform X3 [Phascolarctos cinereus]